MQTTCVNRHLAAALALAGAVAAGHPGPSLAADGGALKRYVSDSPPFVLHKPSTWVVHPATSADGLRVAVSSPDGLSVAEVDYANNRHEHPDSLKLMAARVHDMKAHLPDLAVSEVSVCKDNELSCAVATLSYTANRVPTRGRYYFHADRELTVVRSFRAPAARLSQERALLLDVLTNINLRGSRPPPVKYVDRRAADGSLSLSLPDNWGFLAQKGTVLAGAPQGGSGFVFTVFSVMPQAYGVVPPVGVIVSPYRPPQEFIHNIFDKFRNQQTRVLASQPDPGAAAACPQQIGRQCEAADVQLSWVSPEDVTCVGSFKVLNAIPNLTGQWFSIIAGVWGPADNLAQQMPVLEHVAGSFSINDRYARQYIQQGMAHLQELQRKTRSAMQSLYSAIEQNQHDYEARVARKESSDAKWDDYRRGNSYWISDLEGGKVYATDPWGTQDTRTGDRVEGPPYNYIHFEGQNPRHPSENMREISSYELKQLNQ